jgi:two-component system, OmpR family, response regulator
MEGREGRPEEDCNARAGPTRVAAEEPTPLVYLLLVEDDETLGDMVRRGLDASGYRVHWEQDGDAAYDRASSGAYDALILDLMLPGLDGMTLVRSLRAAGVRTPVLCLTARAAVDDKVAGLDAGADDYLTKPFVFDELLARLRALLRRPRDVVVSDPLTAGSLRLSPADRQVTVAGHRLDVPGREFDLLEYLIRNRGRTLPRDVVLDRIWGDAPSPRANVVDVTISRLRRRLAAAGWEGRIVAVPGLGYRLADVEQGPER